jgi:NTE family protein
MVGAAYLAGNLDKLERWVLDANQLDLIKFFEVRLTKTGFVDIDQFQQFLHDNVVDSDRAIEDLPRTFAAVATDVNTGREIWFTDGNTLEAAKASMALPGLFSPVKHEDRWLVDGGLVNPVPVSACHALGADYVIAVNLNADIVAKRDTGKSPGLFDVVSNSINIFQDRITRSRLAGDPADIVISPKLAHIGLLDFHRAKEAIAEGEERTLRVIDDIRQATAKSR